MTIKASEWHSLTEMGGYHTGWDGGGSYEWKLGSHPEHLSEELCLTLIWSLINPPPVLVQEITWLPSIYVSLTWSLTLNKAPVSVS